MNIITALFTNLHQSFGLLDPDIPAENPVLLSRGELPHNALKAEAKAFKTDTFPHIQD